jgi:5'(3')-deoxyribonucleotidase/phosphopantetheine adenylyltransferase
MLLKELFLKEDDQSTAVFAFGRFNPPTKGHEKLIQTVRSVAQRMDAKPYVFVTQSQDKKNPLSQKERIDYIKSTGRFNDIEIGDVSVKTIVQALQKLMNEGRTRVVIVAGSDRVDYFKNFLNTYNKKNDKAGNLVFDFDYVDAVSSGERDPDAEGVAGFSASQARALAANDDYEGFKRVAMDNSEDQIQAIFSAVQSKIGKKVAMNNEKLYTEADMQDQKPTVYVDMDGVVADFFGGVEQMFGVKHWKELTSKLSGGDLKQEVIDKITGSDFFAHLPKFNTADQLIEMVKNFTGGSYSVLTSPLIGDHENSAEQKKVWIRKHMPNPDAVIVTGRKESYAVNKQTKQPNILIDDRPVNIERWTGRGGYGILYQANRDSLTKVEQGLKNYGENNGN